MKLQAVKSLKLILIVSSALAMISLSQVILNSSQYGTGWLMYVQALPIPFFILLAAFSSLDLLKKDYKTLTGSLLEKNTTRSGCTIKIRTKSGKISKFRIPTKSCDEIKEIEVGQDIEIQSFRRTSVITQIRAI